MQISKKVIEAVKGRILRDFIFIFDWLIEVPAMLCWGIALALIIICIIAAVASAQYPYVVLLLLFGYFVFSIPRMVFYLELDKKYKNWKAKVVGEDKKC